MATNPSTDNYTLGKGHLTFNQLVSGSYQGELSLGNAPAFTFSLAIEKLDHYSSLGGLKAKDKTVITEISPTCTFTLDEMSDANINKLFMGTSDGGVANSQTLAGETMSTTIASAVAGQYYSLDHRGLQVVRGAYTVTTGAPVVGEVLTDTTSTTTAEVLYLETISGTLYMWLGKVTDVGTGFPTLWTNNGAITTSTGLTAGNWVGTPEYVSDVIIDDGVAEFRSGTDFTVNAELGRIYITPGTTLSLTSLTVQYDLNAATYTTINGLQSTSIDGMLRYVSDNPEGPNMELRLWSVSLTPDGDTAFIGDEWSTMSFTGEILKDEAGHPTNPYLEVIVASS